MSFASPGWPVKGSLVGLPEREGQTERYDPQAHLAHPAQQSET